MHISLLVDAVENGSRNVTDALCDNPDNCAGETESINGLKATSTDNPIPTKQIVSKLL